MSKKKRRNKRTKRTGARKPKAGETIVHCGHYGLTSLHWLRLREPRETHLGEANMIGACEPCYLVGRRNADAIKADQVAVLDEAA